MSQHDSETDRRNVSRRGLIATGATLSTVGCLGLFDDEPSDQPTTTTGTYTTVPKTTTFAPATGSRTPYSEVPPIRLGDGALFVFFFDYGQQASIEWWRETFPDVEPLIEDGTISFRFAAYPIPVSRWSVMVPCALLEVRHQLDQQAAVAYHERLIDAAPDYSVSTLGQLAGAVGADREAVERAANSRRRRAQLFAIREFGTDNGVDAPPAAYTGETVLSAPDADAIRQALATQ